MFELFNKFDPKEIESSLNNRNRLVKYFLILFGTTISAISFNLFYVPNNFVSSGLSGLAIIFSNFFRFNAVTFLLFGNILLTIISLITIGFKKSYRSFIGALIFTAIVYLTKDIAHFMNFSFDNILLYVIAAGVVGGFGEALVYKMGYTTGGTSILAQIIVEYTKQPIGKILRVIGTLIIIAGGFTFGYTMIMYSIIIVSISSFIIDKVLIGISESKMFLVITKKEKDIKKYLMEIGNCGVTELESRGAYSRDKLNILMCAVPTQKYYSLKLAIQEIDSNVFIIVSDCYEVFGGTKRKKLPVENDN